MQTVALVWPATVGWGCEGVGLEQRVLALEPDSAGPGPGPEPAGDGQTVRHLCIAWLAVETSVACWHWKHQ